MFRMHGSAGSLYSTAQKDQRKYGRQKLESNLHMNRQTYSREIRCDVISLDKHNWEALQQITTHQFNTHFAQSIVPSQVFGLGLGKEKR